MWFFLLPYFDTFTQNGMKDVSHKHKHFFFFFSFLNLNHTSSHIFQIKATYVLSYYVFQKYHCFLKNQIRKDCLQFIDNLIGLSVLINVAISRLFLLSMAIDQFGHDVKDFWITLNTLREYKRPKSSVTTSDHISSSHSVKLSL